MTQVKRTDPELVKELEALAEAWDASLRQNSLLSHERKQTYGYAVRQFIKWVKEGQSSRLPRSQGKP